VILRPLTLDLARALVPHLAARDRTEIQRAYPNLERWARSRCELPGAAWALVRDDQVLAAGGIIFEGATGILWIAGREGWTRHVKHALRAFREIKASGVVRRLECKACTDNASAQRFARRLGFRPLGAAAGFVAYGMAL
jgi:RimJ/RimL family protein N-acetyltransferase